MSQSRRPRSERRAEERAASSDASGKSHRTLWTRIIIAAVVLIVVAGIAFAALYPTYIAPFRITVITVDGNEIKMDYFLRITKLTGADPFETLSTLSEQWLVKIEAPNYGIEVSDEEVDQQLRAIARGDSEFISESEFNEWYRQRINLADFSDEEYRDLIKTGMLADKLHLYFAARVPTVAEQVHLYSLFLDTQEEAEEARARWEAGEDFIELAIEITNDEFTRENGGELGWFPQGVMTPQFDYEAFNMAAGNVSQPIPLFTPEDDQSVGQDRSIMGWALFWVRDRVPARELDETSIEVLRGKALEDWLGVEITRHEIKYFGLEGSFDSQTYAWINWQLAKD